MKIQLVNYVEPILIGDELTSDQAQTIPHYQSNDKKLFKIIAGIHGLPSIDFSALSEEDCKKIGWVDVEKLAMKECVCGTGDCSHVKSYIRGFKAAQALNEKKFSGEDVRKAIEMAREIIDGKEVFELEGILGLTEVCTHNCSVHSVDKIIQSLSQPKVFDVEVEMEAYKVNGMSDEASSWRPKITNNSIKVTKVL